MEEIELNTGLEDVKKSNKNGWIVFVALFIASIVVFIVVSALLEPKGTSKLDVSNTKMTVKYTAYLGYSANIEGLIENKSHKKYSYVSVEFSVYDSAGNNLGTARANINNLASGDYWFFEATLLSYSKIKPASYKLVEINTR